MNFNELVQIMESSIDYARNHFSADVFVDYKNKKPRLKPEISAQIKYHVTKFNEIVPVKKFFIKGSILTKQYGPKADIDVYIMADVPDKESVKKKIEKLWSKLDGTLAFGTKYPLQYYISEVDYDFNKTEAAYDLQKDRWIKQTDPKDINVANYRKDLEDVLNKMDLQAGELKRDVLDYDHLIDIPEGALKKLKKLLDDKLKEINYDISILLKSYNEIKTARNDAFEKDMTDKEIEKFGRKTHLPGNVIFKFLERYYYIQLVRNIKDIIGDDEKVQPDEVGKIKDAMVKEGACGSPCARRQQVGFTGMNRLHQNLLPAMHKADPTEIIQVKNIKDGKANNTPVKGVILQRIIKKYNIGDLSQTNPRKLGNTGITIMWCNNSKCFVLRK